MSSTLRITGRIRGMILNYFTIRECYRNAQLPSNSRPLAPIWIPTSMGCSFICGQNNWMWGLQNTHQGKSFWTLSNQKLIQALTHNEPGCLHKCSLVCTGRLYCRLLSTCSVHWTRCPTTQYQQMLSYPGLQTVTCDRVQRLEYAYNFLPSQKLNGLIAESKHVPEAVLEHVNVKLAYPWIVLCWIAWFSKLPFGSLTWISLTKS